MYTTTTYNTSTDDSATVLAVLGVVVIFALVVYVLMAFFLGKIFKKAGVPAWKAWVPVYSSWITLKLGDQPGFWAILSLIPIVNIVTAVFYYIACYEIGLKLQKEGWFVLLAIFFFPIWVIILAVDRSTWQDSRSNIAPNPQQRRPPLPPQTL